MRQWLTTALISAAVCTLIGLGWAEIPTKEERIRDSALNPEYCTWRAEWIRLWPWPKREKGDPPLVACYRKDFTLSAKARQAAITLTPWTADRYWFMVNGQVVAEPLPGRVRGLRNLDLTKFLQAGHNVIAFKGETTHNMGLYLLAEGIVFGEDGSIVRLMTDKTWKGGWSLPDGWASPETNPETLPSPQGLGSTRWDTKCQINPPYYGPIQIAPQGREQPIFDEEKPIQLNITLLNMRGSDQPSPALSYEIMDEFSRKTIDQGTLSLSPQGKLDLAGQIRQEPLPAGAYRFRFLLTAAGEEIDRRDYEVASVGVIKQRLVEGTHYEDGLELRKIWSVDCTEEPQPGEFTARYVRAKRKEDRDVATRVVEGPAGKYRTFEQSRAGIYFAYRFKVENLFKPHLAVVEWPDDAGRNFQAHVMEGTSMISKAWYDAIRGWARGEAAVIYDDKYPLSNKMQKLHFIYWPNEEEEAFHVFDLGQGKAPAAASRITVYEILNDIPALKIADAGDHLIGCHTERGPYTAAATYYTGPLGRWFVSRIAGVDHPEFYRNWYTTTENMIKRMRFSGQNLYQMGHFMYHGVLYPSKRYIFAQNYYQGNDANRDYIGLMLHMFGRNGMSMISNIEYQNTPDLLAASPATEEEVRKGAPTLFCVGKNGRFATPHGAFGGVNYFHPKVQEGILTIVEELAELYAQYPAWKGIAFLLSRAFGPMSHGNWGDEPLDWGYEDYTIELFRKETKIRVPVDSKDPDRFQKRYDWLMANAKQKWIDWRCSQYTRLYRKLRDRLVRARPDLKLYLFCAEPLKGSKYLFGWTSAKPGYQWDFSDPEMMKGVMKSFGFDLDALKKERGIVTSYFFLSPGTPQALGHSTREYQDLLHSQTWQDLFSNDGKGGAYIWAGFAEWHMAPGSSAATFAPGEWVFQESDDGSQAYPWPPGPYLNDAFVNVLVRSNPTLMPHSLSDVNDPSGRLHEMRLFARAYRSLPNGKYQRLTGNGLDKNIWVERTRAKGTEYAYAANANWWEVEATLTFGRGAKVHDLIKDQPVKLRDGKWSFHLGPYQVQTFRITGGTSPRGSAIQGAQVEVPKEAESSANEALAEAKETVARARAKEAEIRDLPGWERVEYLEEMISQTEKLKAAGDISRAYQIANSWTLKQAQEQVVKEALEAIPFLVLGPFGKPEDTQGAGKIHANPEVVAEFKGMETPYIPETGEIDFTKKYRVYPDTELGWQLSVKSHFLSFYGRCHSEPPLWMVAYAYTEVYSPEERDASIWVGSDHAIWVWVNGRIVLKYGGHGAPRGGQRPSAPDQNRGNCHLQKGWNRVLVKAVQRGTARVFFRITDRDRNPIDDLRFRVPKA